MKAIAVRHDKLFVAPELERSRKDKQFEERLHASIDQIGLVEPLKVASAGDGKYLIVDGMLRWRAIQEIRAADETRFRTVPAYVVSHKRRFEIRFQTDIYQDLLPSQLAALVEHLHQNDHIRKSQIAAYIGVSAPTVRNYTGLWRLIQRGGLFAKIVELMDAGVLPASNPYAWLRLTEEGLDRAIRAISDGQTSEEWVGDSLVKAAAGQGLRMSLKAVEAVTGGLPSDCYREDEGVRSQKREIGLRRGKQTAPPRAVHDTGEAIRNLQSVVDRSGDPVLRIAAKSLLEALA